MGGIISATQAAELSPALRKLYKVALEPEKHGDLLRLLGREFLNSSDMRPGYFSTPVDLPKGNVDQRLGKINEWNKLLGDRAISGIPGDRNNGPRGFSDRQGNTFSDFDSSFGTERRSMTDALQARGSMPPGTTRYSPTLWGDTDMNRVGTGGKNFYNAAFTATLAHPDKPLNLTGALSDINQERRTANMLPIYEKHGPDANRIIMAERQLAPSLGYVGASGPGYRRVQDFHSMTNEQQVGLMNAILAQRAGQNVDDAGITALSAARHSAPGSFAEAMGNQRVADWQKLGFDPQEPFDPSFANMKSPEQTEALANLMHNIYKDGKWDSPSTGFDSLRRATLANEFSKGASWQDAPEWLTKGLGRAVGGRVPPSPNPGQMRQLAGPLSMYPRGR